jgi:endonuclease IV
MLHQQASNASQAQARLLDLNTERIYMHIEYICNINCSLPQLQNQSKDCFQPSQLR